MDTIKVKINDKEYNLLLAKTEEEKERGLQNVESMEDNEGMFFDYRDNPEMNIAFWMKDTDIPLKIIFVDDDDIVTKVYNGEPNSEELLEGNNASYVIELNQSEKVRKGNEVEILDENDFADLPKNKMLVLNEDGSVQFSIEGSNRIFSRISSRVIIRKAKRAVKSKSDADYKSLGRYIFNELERQDNREEQYVDLPENSDK